MNAPICRRSGILLHPTSLPNPFGSGDFGASAYHFVDWLQAGSQKLWQMLPLNGVGPGNSPYMSPSAFAGNELLIDLEALKNAGWLDAEDLIVTHPFPEHRVDFHHVRIFRSLRLRLAAQRFFSQNGAKNDAFVAFCQAEKSWLDDYALFMSLDAHYGIKGAVWQDWEPSLVKREPKALAEAAKKFADDVQFWQFCQWNFYTQWAALKAYANARGVSMIGDVPIFISPHSADVWANQHLFDLEPNGRLKTVAGVPPDYFSANGQHWGNPLYRWEAHKKDHYAWWSARLKTLLNLCDIVRIDHFRGFEAFWEIPAGSKNAIGGAWKKGPGMDFFKALFSQLKLKTEKIGETRIIAEDLGILTNEVIALRNETGFPGMRILQFAFDGSSDNFYQPHNYDQNTVVYTGTHDNDTTLGWWEKLKDYEQDHVRRYLNTSGEAINWTLIAAAERSVAAMAIIPMQDVLGLGSDARMNCPSQATGAWEWRFSWAQVFPWDSEQLAMMTKLYGRA